MKFDTEIKFVLLDIEGTTCPASFVGDVLFPFASNQLLPYLINHQAETPVKQLLAEIHSAWQRETDPEAMALATNRLTRSSRPLAFNIQTGPGSVTVTSQLAGVRTDSMEVSDRSRSVDLAAVSDSAEKHDPVELSDSAEGCDTAGNGEKEAAADLQTLSAEDATVYLDWLIKKDRKLTALKDLQGLIWEEGYRKGNLVAPLFADVPDALQDWHNRGFQLGVYSSGSVTAQKLLYAHTTYGNLSHVFSHWFDTHTGPKNHPLSYAKIASIVQAQPETILFISDSPAELTAAVAARYTVLYSDRPGNSYQNTKGFASIQNFSEIEFNASL
jgi:2,3-diketo-5-methylthio-1-phosphopentane phosphatase